MVGPVIPLVAAPAPPNTVSTGIGSGSGGSSIQYLSWQPTSNPNPNLIRKQQPLLPMLDSPPITTTSTAIFPNNPSHHHHHHHMVVVPSSTATVSTSGTTCQDCGNQAKKDCAYRRCRTCCKSRQFVCPTHVKSTWVPASRRRERQHLAAALAATTSGSKKPRLVTSNSNSHTSTSNTPRSFDTSSSHQDGGSLPWHVRAPAEFRCVRVTSIDDGEDEYAYQTMVRIGGHVFKGFLYDQGVEDAEDNSSVGGEDKLKANVNNYTAVPNLSELHLGGGGSGGGRGDMGGSSSGLLVGVPPDVFGSGSGGSMVGVGTAYGNTMN